MGRWAQRTRGGGGGAPSSLLTFMTDAGFTAFTNEGQITWNRAVDVTLLDLNDFRSNPTGIVPVDFTQNGPTQAIVDYGEDVTAEVSVTYSGHNTNFVTPQTQS